MKKFLLIVLIVISCGVSGCKMPSTSVRTIDDRPTLAFKNAPDGAILFVDGISMGVASEYDGDPNVLLAGETLRYTHTVTNSGNTTGTFDLSAAAELADQSHLLRREVEHYLAQLRVAS